MNDIIVRRATMSDVDQIVDVDNRVWVGSQRTTREVITQRIHNYSEGVPVCVYEDKIVGYGSVLIRDTLPHAFTWDEISGGGSLSPHTPGGSYMYGVSLTALPGVHKDIGDSIFAYAFDLCLKEGCSFFALGSRIPGLKKWIENNPDKNAADYVSLVHKNGPRDAELRFYKNQGFTIDRLLPEYFPDPDSMDYGVLVTLQVD